MSANDEHELHSDPQVEPSEITYHLRRFANGEQAALDDLITAASQRLQRLAHHMLARFTGPRRWEQTDDVLQNAMVRLLRALADVRPQASDEFLSLAALQIRRELIDLTRHYYGPQGHGTHHASWPANDANAPTMTHSNDAPGPFQLTEWREVHQRVDDLPSELREVVSLLYYHGLTQVETADHLQVSVRTVQRRWQKALLELHSILKDEHSANV